jgi:hypothetical protein
VPWTSTFARLGYELALTESPPSPPFPGAIYALDRQALTDLPCARFLPLGRAVPYGEDGFPLDFDDLATSQPGRSVLAAAKLDVDDLGEFLRRHLADRPLASPARFATIASSLSHFFEAYVNELAVGRNIYVVFAGGDDALCVGPLDDILRFVVQIRHSFAEWTAGTTLTLSCGIAAGAASTPVLQLTASAEDALAESKSFADGPKTKDAITVLGQTLSWSEFDAAWELRERLVRIISGDDPVARSLLSHLQALSAIDSASGDPAYGPAVWRAYYHLRRFFERHDLPSSELEDWYGRALARRGARQLALAATLARLATAVSGTGGEGP